MEEVFILSATRTPIAAFNSSFKDTPAVNLGAITVKEALRRANINPDMVDEVIFGNARQAGNGPNPARQISIKGGIPITVPAFTVNRACGSGSEAIIIGYERILLNRADIIIAGGTENMTRTPHLLMGARSGFRLGDIQLLDGMYKDGFFCPIAEQLMGQTAENLAEKYNISREEQDIYAMETYHRCEKAQKEGRFNDEITPVEVEDKKGEKILITKDEHPREGVTLEKLAKLPPVFKENGTVTAGNSCGIGDAASCVVLASKRKVNELNITPLARIVDYEISAVDPRYMGIAPVEACKKILKRTNLTFDDIDLIELNEAFAAQVLACERELEYDRTKRNVNGGAIALGHPIGATGCRIVVTLLYEMIKRNSKLGLATLCMSGGQAHAIIIER